MKVIDLGHGGRAIEPESVADSVETISATLLQRSQVSDEAIKLYQSYIQRTSPQNASTEFLPFKES